MDRGGTSDPYAVLKNDFNKQNYKTKVIDKTLEPKWNEDFKFLNPTQNGEIKITLWDKDTWKRDDFLGEVKLSLSNFADGQLHDIWEKLEKEPKKKARERAELHLRVQVQIKQASGNQTVINSNSFSEVYNMGKELGSGGFSIVKECVHKQTKVKRAAKIINKKGLSSGELQLLTREVAIMEKLHHPNIVELVEVFDEPDKLILILELVKGGELFDKIVEKGCYSEKDAAHITQQILEAVFYLHGNGITHRDLKPENLLCVGDAAEVIKIADFGLSKEGEDLRTSCGSPGYVAPEILQGSDVYDQTVDVWALGVITYVLLCGFPPFYGDSPQELCQRIVAGKYSFPDPEWTYISVQAKDFVQQCLNIHASSRPSSKQLLTHPWMTTASATNLKSFDAVKSNLKKTNSKK
eukprot:TRINITY_DN12218_c0_g1_i1.p1 TRINITY_DN12218_c0_g1~~TRINITY_DN12218_c0_g1_i1.p1  ORF type:complete len:429 (+),score=105.57 TRINITY_DN12218_c0_g1_i1:62-1288(+)